MLKKIIAIRRATVGDINHLIRFQQQIADYHSRLDKIYNNSKKIPVMRTRGHLLSLLKKRGNRIYVLLHNDQIVGFATAHIKKMNPAFSITKIGHIGTVFVERSHRKLGLARIAINESVRWFKRNHVAYVDLSVNIKNKTGLSAWRKIGFKDWTLTLRKKV